jgi:hypothetical protein
MGPERENGFDSSSSRPFYKECCYHRQSSGQQKSFAQRAGVGPSDAELLRQPGWVQFIAVTSRRTGKSEVHHVHRLEKSALSEQACKAATLMLGMKLVLKSAMIEE